MTETSATPLVIALSLFASVAVVVLVRFLKARQSPTVRSKILVLIVGLAVGELTTLPTLLVAFLGEELLGLEESNLAYWLAIAVYGALILYVIVLLFPWREVEALAAKPDASLRDVLARLRKDDG